MTTKGRKGLSGGQHKERVQVKINWTGAQLAQERCIVSSQLSSLTSAQHATLLGDNAVMTDGAEGSYVKGWQDIDSDDEDALRQLPPGEEGDLHSHAGEADFQAIFDGVRPGRGDLHIRDDRLQKGVDSWNRQMPALVDAERVAQVQRSKYATAKIPPIERLSYT
ncbi:hypothetical protein DFH07DRAFT_968069 [Mycena maculata]|uniref:Uncharacterized protein n=1 Tax=Mycena maculata TaxID=230809 RepID=A0AAD7I221_9AGAR|nr:hypothetical protein DFH07DRAFT_968069 [Mycena maculata]